MEVTALQRAHIDEVSRLFAMRYRAEKRQLPILPVRHEDPAGVVPLLAELSRRTAGMAALRGGRLCGYLIRPMTGERIVQARRSHL